MKLTATFLAMGIAASACTTTPAFDPVTDTLSVSELDLATSSFRDVCVETLPDFGQSEAVLAARGFTALAVPGTDGRSSGVYGTGQKSVTVLRLVPDDRTQLCGVAFLGPEETGIIDRAFLKTTAALPGGNERRTLSAPGEDRAFHLQNKSTLLFETRRKIDGVTHFVYLTPPVTAEAAQRIAAQ